MNSADKQLYKYLLRYGAIFGLSLCLIVIINYSVDPYGLFDTKRINGYNELKPAASPRVRVTKPYQVNRINPRTIIAGNSRPEIGIDPTVSCWPDESKPVFNLGIPGAEVYMATRYIQHAIVNNDVKRIYWGLDFMDFLNDGSVNNRVVWPPEPLAFEDRLAVTVHGDTNSKYYMRKIQDYVNASLSLDALGDSAQTLFRQANKNTPTLRRDGFRPRRDFFDIMALEGQGLIFKQVNLATAEVFFRPDQDIITDDEFKSIQFESVRQLLMFAKDRNVDIVLFINPYHADYLSIIQIAGLWDKFADWKRLLANIADEFDFPLWDFSGYNQFSNPPPPVIGDNKTILEWFWEPAHYRSEYGNLMLSQMLNRPCGDQTASANGRLLNKDNVNDHLRSSDERMVRYNAEHTVAVNRLKKFLGLER